MDEFQRTTQYLKRSMETYKAYEQSEEKFVIGNINKLIANMMMLNGKHKNFSGIQKNNLSKEIEKHAKDSESYAKIEKYFKDMEIIINGLSQKHREIKAAVNNILKKDPRVTVISYYDSKPSKWSMNLDDRHWGKGVSKSLVELTDKMIELEKQGKKPDNEYVPIGDKSYICEITIDGASGAPDSINEADIDLEATDKKTIGYRKYYHDVRADIQKKISKFDIDKGDVVSKTIIHFYQMNNSIVFNQVFIKLSDGKLKGLVDDIDNEIINY